MNRLVVVALFVFALSTQAMAVNLKQRLLNADAKLNLRREVSAAKVDSDDNMFIRGPMVAADVVIKTPETLKLIEPQDSFRFKSTLPSSDMSADMFGLNGFYNYGNNVGLGAGMPISTMLFPPPSYMWAAPSLTGPYGAAPMGAGSLADYGTMSLGSYGGVYGGDPYGGAGSLYPRSYLTSYTAGMDPDFASPRVMPWGHSSDPHEHFSDGTPYDVHLTKYDKWPEVKKA